MRLRGESVKNNNNCKKRPGGNANVPGIILSYLNYWRQFQRDALYPNILRVLWAENVSLTYRKYSIFWLKIEVEFSFARERQSERGRGRGKRERGKGNMRSATRNRLHVCGNPARDHAFEKSIYLFGSRWRVRLFTLNRPLESIDRANTEIYVLYIRTICLMFYKILR